MTKNVESRCIELGEYIAQNKTTVRQTAKVFGISKSSSVTFACVIDY